MKQALIKYNRYEYPWYIGYIEYKQHIFPAEFSVHVLCQPIRLLPNHIGKYLE